jgi:cell division transport system permease protein
MNKPEDKFAKRRLRTSYITSLTSITLMLFVLGFFGLLILHANTIKKHVKENIRMNVFMNAEVNESEIFRLKKNLDASFGIKSTNYISKEEGAKKYADEIGEDFLQFLDGVNPIHAQIEVFLNEDYANVDSLQMISDRISKSEIVEEVRFHKDYVQTINDNISKISIFLLFFSGFMLLISIVLISNTIRLSIYAHRFLIRTMKLIGATKGFIRAPFVWKSIFQGFIAALLSSALLALVLFKLHEEYNELISIQNIEIYLMVFGGLIAMGVIITGISTFFAINKYLKINMDKLYMM